MDYELYLEIALANDLDGTQYKKGDLATIVEIDEENGKNVFTVEFYTSLGETLTSHKVLESDIMPIPKSTIVCIRELI
jgi:hypothetical protein